MGRHAARSLEIEAARLAEIGGDLLGICGDPEHTSGAHLPARELPADDYTREGPLNNPVADWDACCAIDIGMNWPASRQWLAWLIKEIREGRITGIFEVIGSLDGTNVRYWSVNNTPGWPQNGEHYTGSGHDRWTHVAIGRRNTTRDYGVLKGWTANGREDDDMPRMVSVSNKKDQDIAAEWVALTFDTEASDPDHDHADAGGPTLLQTYAYFNSTVSVTLKALPAGTTVKTRMVEVAKETGYPVTKAYPVQETMATTGDTNIQWGQVGSLGKTRLLRAQIKLYPAVAGTPVTAKAAAAAARVLYWKR